MKRPRFHKRIPSLVALALVLAAYTAQGKNVGDRGPALTPKQIKEVRAVWVVRNSIKTRKAIGTIIEAMRRNNFNVAIVQVRGRGDAFYRSDFVPRASGIESDLDPLSEFIRLAKPAGISVHVWVNLFLAADRETVAWAPADHLIRAHKDWFLRDRDGRSMLDYSPAQWNKARVEGAFLDPSLPAVRSYNIRVIQEILDRYAVDGVHLDYVRYPASIPGTSSDFGAGTALRASGSKAVATDFAPARDARSQFVTKMVVEIRDVMRQKYPATILSAAVWPNKQKITEHIFQPWPEWLRKGFIDYTFLMSYYDTKEMHDSRMKEFLDPTINGRMVIGIGMYKKPRPDVVSHQLLSARTIGAAGVCFFEAEWLIKRESHQKASGQTPSAFQDRSAHGLFRQPAVKPVM